MQLHITRKTAAVLICISSRSVKQIFLFQSFLDSLFNWLFVKNLLCLINEKDQSGMNATGGHIDLYKSHICHSKSATIVVHFELLA